MNLITFFWKSSIGKKWLVALTGLVLVGYIIGHLLGNLQIFTQPKQINDYAVFLHSMPMLLWAVRVFLIACFVLHIVVTIKLTVENRAARPERYQKKAHVQATWASRLMALSGLTVLAFVVFHILHFTTRSVNPELRPLHENGLLLSEYDVHSMVVIGFQHHPLVVAFYALGLFLLCLHLSHGFSSLLQTFGLNSKKTMSPISHGGRVLAWLIFAGYVSIPLAVWFGKLRIQAPSPAKPAAMHAPAAAANSTHSPVLPL